MTDAESVERRAVQIADCFGDANYLAGYWPYGISADEVEGWARHYVGAEEGPVHDLEHQALPLRGWIASRWAGYLAREIWLGMEDAR